MILRIPWISESRYALPSLVILAVSSAAILRTYNQLSATNFFWPKWTETRRILTAAYVQLYCCIEGEVALHDFQASSSIVTELLERSKANHPAVIPLIGTWKTLSDLIRELFPWMCRGPPLILQSRQRLPASSHTHHQTRHRSTILCRLKRDELYGTIARDLRSTTTDQSPPSLQWFGHPV